MGDRCMWGVTITTNMTTTSAAEVSDVTQSSEAFRSVHQHTSGPNTGYGKVYQESDGVVRQPAGHERLGRRRKDPVGT
jgi:hypothetical protein